MKLQKRNIPDDVPRNPRTKPCKSQKYPAGLQLRHRSSEHMVLDEQFPDLVAEGFPDHAKRSTCLAILRLERSEYITPRSTR